ncbi:MAG: serine/threonine protein kinase [Bacteroidales bacterium]|nr:serine/threonine protein kinase [Bacteroidales bacterium]
MNDASTSGPIEERFLSADDSRSTYEPLPSHGFNQLVKVRRQGRWFMLKGLKEEFRAQAIYRELLKKEYALMAGLDHPGIIKAFAKEINEELGPCIVMEYVDGMPLNDFLATRPTTAVRRKITDQLTDALSYIHSKQITHRDLKPGNILITRNGANVKIIDFGLSDSDDYAILKQSAGTRAYMAPEQLQGLEATNYKSDIYSFSLILREIFPHRYRHIAARCTRTASDSRYSDMEAVRSALHRSDLRRHAIPYFGMGLALVLALLLPARRMANPLQADQGRKDSRSADQIAYLDEYSWYSNNMMQQFFSQAESGNSYREVMLAKLTKANLDLKRKITEMSRRYGEGSPEQLAFLSQCGFWQESFQDKVVKCIEQECPSFEEAYAKGRLSQQARDSLEWLISPTITTLDATEITATSAMAGVELPDDSFVGDSRIGLCWGPLHFPTTQGRHAELDLSEGRDRTMLTGLAPGSTYFIRAYIETAAGTSYGNEISFTTAAGVTAFPEGTVPGWFSVGEGKQVYFSRGNLQYQASTQTWRFAPHPYDYIGKDNMNLSPAWSGWIDLFGWGTSGYDHGAVDYQPWSENKVVQSNDLHQAYGDPACNLYDRDGRADWGYNRIANGGNAEHLWRTPKVSEWVYLLFIRDTASGIRYAKARVGDINGLVLLPDNWSGSVWPLNAVNRTDVSFDVNRISVSDWTACLEKAGAAFLPESGARTVSGVFLRMAGYHSSDAAAGDAWHLTMDQHGLFLDANGHRGDGLAVRLVRDAD